MWFLTMEDIISNSLLEMNKMGDCDGILIDDAIRYGNMVAKDLCKKGFFTKVKINSCMIDSFDKSYYPYFLKFLYCDTFGYQISDNAFIHDIEKRFRNPLPIEVIDSMTSQNIIEYTLMDKVRIENSKKRVLKKDDTN